MSVGGISCIICDVTRWRGLVFEVAIDDDSYIGYECLCHAIRYAADASKFACKFGRESFTEKSANQKVSQESNQPTRTSHSKPEPT